VDLAPLSQAREGTPAGEPAGNGQIVSGRSDGRRWAVFMAASGQLSGRLWAVSRGRRHAVESSPSPIPRWEPSWEPTVADIRPHRARSGVRSIYLTSHWATVSDIERRRASPSHRRGQRGDYPTSYSPSESRWCNSLHLSRVPPNPWVKEGLANCLRQCPIASHVGRSGPGLRHGPRLLGRRLGG